MFLAKGACRATVGTDSLARQPQLSEARTGSGSCIPPLPREGGVGVGLQRGPEPVLVVFAVNN